MSDVTLWGLLIVATIWGASCEWPEGVRVFLYIFHTVLYLAGLFVWLS